MYEMCGSLSRRDAGAGGAAVRRARRGSGIARAGAILTVVLAVALPLPAAEVEVLWDGFRGDPEGRAWRSFESGSQTQPASTWTFRGSDVIWNYGPGVSVWSSPAIAQIGERVVCFVGSYDNNVYALDVATGKELWRYPTGNGVHSPPAVMRLEGRECVVVSSSDRTVYCLDAKTGAKIWAHEVYEWGHSVGRAFVAAPVIVSGPQGPSVLVVWWVYDTAAKRVTEMAEVRLLAADTGRRRWKRQFAESHPSHPVVGEIEGRLRIYVGCRDGNLYCLDGEDGEEVWRRTSKFPVDATPVLLKGAGGEPPLVLVGSKFGDLRAFDAVAGDIAWSFKARHWVDATPAIVRAADGRDLAVFGSYDGRVYCLDARTGKSQWRYNTQGNVVASAAVVPREDGFEVYIPSDDDMLHAIDGRRGRALWTVSPGPFLWAYRGLGDTIWASPAVARIGEVDMLIVPFYDGRVHAYRLDRADEWLHEVGDPAYGRSMLARIGTTMLATLALALAFVRFGTVRRLDRE